MSCGAWISNDRSPVKGARRTCVLAAGHYVERDEGAGAVSWHTDCPDAHGFGYPPKDHDHEHLGGLCLTWSDYAEGAHPSEPQPPAGPAGVSKPGRSLSGLGGYRAQIEIGDTGLTVFGPARFVANVVRAFADAFEEEAER